MKRFLTPLLALACCLLTSCASLVGPRDIELPLAKLQGSLERRFPMNHRLLDIFDVNLTRPQLSLAADGDRIALSLDAAVAPVFLRQSWHGTLAFSGRLVLDPARGAVLMDEPRVERFTVDGVDEARQRQLAGIANVLMQQVAAQTTLYHFRPEDLRYAGVQFVPTRIRTNARALIVSVEPVK